MAINRGINRSRRVFSVSFGFRESTLGLLFSLCLVAFGCGPGEDAVVSVGAEPESAESQEVDARLVADVAALEAGVPFTLAARFAIPPNAHIYWWHPGSSGLATDVAWDLPQGFTAGPIEWPAPTRFEFPEIDDISYGYADEVLLLSEIAPPDDLSGDSVSTLSANLFWLVCLDDGQCIPGEITVEIELPSGDSEPSQSRAAIERARAAVPTSLGSDSDPLTVDRSETGALSIRPLAPWQFSGEAAQFFPYDGPAWNLARGAGVAFQQKPGAASRAAGVLRVVMTHSETGEAKTFRFRIGTAP